MESCELIIYNTFCSKLGMYYLKFLYVVHSNKLLLFYIPFILKNLKQINYKHFLNVLIIPENIQFSTYTVNLLFSSLHFNKYSLKFFFTFSDL